MTPPLPPTIPSNLNTILSAIRSKVFLTTHNPTGARLGNKYIRKNLVGPAMMRYYPPAEEKLSTINKRLDRENEEARRLYLKNGGDKRLLAEWDNSQVAPGFKPVERIPNAAGFEGTFWDEREDRRVRKLASRRRIGKGPPKKGQGKRSQMGKR